MSEQAFVRFKDASGEERTVNMAYVHTIRHHSGGCDIYRIANEPFTDYIRAKKETCNKMETYLKRHVPFQKIE